MTGNQLSERIPVDQNQSTFINPNKYEFRIG